MKLVNKKLQKARAMKILEKKIMEGKTNVQLAEDFNVSPPTIARALSLAAKGDIVISFEDRLLKDLLPLAHATLYNALLDNNAKVALEIFKGTNILKRQHAQTPAEQQDSDDLAAYIFAKRHVDFLQEPPYDTVPALPEPNPAAAPSADSPGNFPHPRPAESAQTPETPGRPLLPVPHDLVEAHRPTD